jgi:D-alanyl-D-alanine carboxypeptidase (penicillin-binding protein 5/6)
MYPFFNHFRFLFYAFFLLFSSSAKSLEVDQVLQEVQFYFLIDADTKEVLLSKNADVRISPSSMTKMMTAYVVFDQIKKGRVSLTNQCLIGKDAWRKSGSSMFLNYGDVVSIEDLVKGLLVVSGNDAAIALAETTAGGSNNFVALMNAKAKELNLKNSHFKNPHGLNEEGHYMSLRDLATLATRLYQDFPQYSHYFGMPEFTYHNITQHNRNPLIKGGYDGVVGGKTGYTNDGGYGVIGIVKRDNRRLIAVVNKAKTPRQRAAIITNLFDYGFQNYKKLVFFEQNQEVAQLQTWLGKEEKISVITNQKISFTIPRDKPLDAVKVSVKYRGPIYAPITKGEKVGSLIVEVRGYKTFEYSLFANESVDKVGFVQRIRKIFHYKVRNFLNQLGLTQS